MADESKSSPKVAVTVALIGLAGSLAVAWITTQTKFSSELRDKEAEVTRLKRDLEATEKRLQDHQKELEAKVAAVDDRLKKLDAQVELAQAAADKLTKLVDKAWGSIFGDKPKSKP